MRKILLHCGLKLSADRIYRIKDYLHYSQLFLLFTFCPHCLKPVLGCAGYDVWERPVEYSHDGTFSTDFNSDELENMPLIRIYQPSKRQSFALMQLIANGQAEAVKTLSAVEPGAQSTRGGMLGLSEFSRRAASRNGRDYVLGLRSSNNRNRSV